MAKRKYEDEENSHNGMTCSVLANLEGESVEAPVKVGLVESDKEITLMTSY